MMQDLKELEKLFKLCRKKGVTEVSFDGVVAKFGEIPETRDISDSEDTGAPGQALPELTAEELLFYAVDNVG